MTTAVLAMRATWIRVSVRSDVVALTGLGVLSVALAALTWGTWGDLGSDTGYDLVAAERLSDGQLPYADFTYYYGPLGVGVLGLAFWAFGVSISTAVGVGLVIAAGIVLGTYALARTQASPLGSFLAASLVVPVAFAPNNFSFVSPHTYAATIALLAALGSLLALARYAATSDRRWLLAAGASTGLVALTRPEFELAVVLAATVWLLLRLRAGKGRRRDLLIFAGPAVLIPTVAYGAFLTSLTAHRLVFENLYPAEELQAAGTTLLRSHAPFTVSSLAELGLKTLLYAGGAAGLLLLARVVAEESRLRRPAIVVTGLGTLLLVSISLARPETLRYYLEFAYGWIPAGAVIAVGVLLWRRRSRRGEGTVADQVALGGAIVLAILAVKTYNAFLIHAPRVQFAVYAMPFVAIFLARLHLVELGRRRSGYVLGAAWIAFLAAAGIGLTVKDAHGESQTVQGARGSIASTPESASAYQAALATISARTRADEPILLAPQLTSLYALSGRENPLPQLSLLPGSLPDTADERQAIARLDEARVRLAIIDRRPYSEYGHTSFGESFDRVLAGWIRQRFIHTQTLGTGAPHTPTLEVWERRER